MSTSFASEGQRAPRRSAVFCSMRLLASRHSSECVCSGSRLVASSLHWQCRADSRDSSRPAGKHSVCGSRSSRRLQSTVPLRVRHGHAVPISVSGASSLLSGSHTAVVSARVGGTMHPTVVPSNFVLPHSLTAQPTPPPLSLSPPSLLPSHGHHPDILDQLLCCLCVDGRLFFVDLDTLQVVHTTCVPSALLIKRAPTNKDRPLHKRPRAPAYTGLRGGYGGGPVADHSTQAPADPYYSQYKASCKPQAAAA